MILVTGATGNVGREVVAELTAAGAPFRALSRSEGADLNEPASLRPALDGVRAVFLLPGYRYMRGLTAEFDRAGVERVVLLSSQAAVATDTANAVSAYMIDSEAAVRESGSAWTFLRPSAFMSNALRWLPQLRTGDVVSDAFGDVPIAAIDPADIAAVAVEALLGPGHEGRVYSLSGPEALLPADRVRILGRALGRELRFEALTDEEAWTRMSATTPIEYVRAFFSFYRDHTIDESTVHPTVEKLTGRPARTFAQWAGAHVSDFGARPS
ncbi:NAD(P)H-binding protein [Nonomuraea sp. NN258]|uniref:NAD(P)H-binding protein n=1 Tax=Nonomuraea antri TaxID=2730852 RepID=UPI00156856A0|nr:NAD(P)H-binding protein [Nonomuraea antri]NRQ30241.1 NAD(P)H-binding protein [Nonomuraea antri]